MRQRRWASAAAVSGAAVLLLAACGGGSSHPDEWDDGVAPFVDYVEAARGLEFRHPIEVEFLTDDEWEQSVADDYENLELTDEDRVFLTHGAGMFRALGLAEGDLDLLESYESLSAEGAVGSYDHEEERMVMRGSADDLTVQSTIVHELTHTLQDQHYDLGSLFEDAADSETDSEDAVRALVEGDADRVQEMWVDDLGAAQLEEYEAASEKQGADALEALEDLPESILTFFVAPYVLGAGFIEVLIADSGEVAVDEAFRRPPGPDQHILDPFTYLADERPSGVEIPDLADGEEPVEEMSGSFGALSWHVVLSERLEPSLALSTVDLWETDGYVAFTRDDVLCVRMIFVAKDGAAAIEATEKFEAWRDLMPAAAGAGVERTDDSIQLETCDPGADADVLTGDGRGFAGIAAPAIRSTLSASALAEGATLEQAGCYGSGVVEQLSAEILGAEELSDEQLAEVQEAAFSSRSDCFG